MANRKKKILLPAEPAKPEREVEVDDGTVCDMCGDLLKDHGAWQREEVTIEASEGTVYPEGGSLTITSIDLCLKCFKEKVIPFLQQNGATPPSERD